MLDLTRGRRWLQASAARGVRARETAHQAPSPLAGLQANRRAPRHPGRACAPCAPRDPPARLAGADFHLAREGRPPRRAGVPRGGAAEVLETLPRVECVSEETRTEGWFVTRVTFVSHY